MKDPAMTDTVPLPDMDGLQGLPIWDAIGLWATADQGAYATAMAACVDAEILKAIHSHAAAVSAADNAALRAEVERVREIAREAADAATDHQKSVLILRKRVEELEAASQWRPIETAPKDGRKMLLTYKNRNGKRRTVVGGWVTDEEAAEIDTDGVNASKG